MSNKKSYKVVVAFDVDDRHWEVGDELNPKDLKPSDLEAAIEMGCVELNGNS